MATKLTFINEDNETEPLLKTWDTGQVVTSTRLNRLQQAVSILDANILGISRGDSAPTIINENLNVNGIVSANGINIDNKIITNNNDINIGANANINGAVTIGSASDNKALTVYGDISANSISITSITSPSDISISKNTTITGSVTASNFILNNQSATIETINDNNLITKSMMNNAISDAISELDSSVSIDNEHNDGLHLIASVALNDGKLGNFTYKEIPTVGETTNGLMTIIQATRLANLKIQMNEKAIIANKNKLEIASTNNKQYSFNEQNIAAIGNIVINVDTLIDKYNALVDSVDTNTTNISGINGNISDLQNIRDNIEQAFEKINAINLPQTTGDYKLRVTQEEGEYIYSWIPIDNGGEST